MDRSKVHKGETWNIGGTRLEEALFKGKGTKPKKTLQDRGSGHFFGATSFERQKTGFI